MNTFLNIMAKFTILEFILFFLIDISYKLQIITTLEMDTYIIGSCFLGMVYVITETIKAHK